MGNLFPAYVIDTNALIDLWRRWYARDVFVGVWRNVECLIRSGEVVAPLEVLKELESQRDELYAWAKKQKFFFDLDTHQIDALNAILKDFPGGTFVDVNKTKPDADPFVVALAKVEGWKVISSENPAGTSPRKRIPDVCAHYGIKCLRLLDFFREKQWRFE
jgi:hypothetical protein